MELIRQILANNLTSLRTSRGLSQVELTEKLGINKSTYNQWETGASWPGSTYLEKLAEFYSIRSTALFHDPDIDKASTPPTISKAEIVKDLEALLKKIK